MTIRIWLILGLTLLFAFVIGRIFYSLTLGGQTWAIAGMVSLFVAMAFELRKASSKQ